MKKVNWLLCFTVFQIITIMILLIAVISTNKEYTLSFQIGSIITCLISYAALFMLYRDIMKKAQLEADNEILKKQIALQKEHHMALVENQKQMQMIKDDLLRQMNITHPEAFADEAATRAYINELLAKCDHFHDLDYCQNKVIDAILYHKFLVAHASGIKTESEMIIPEDIAVDALDLMRVFANLLDNAIEACLKLAEELRFIRIQGQMRAGFLVLRIENSKLPQEHVDFDHPVSSKPDKDAHGYGTRIIKEIVNKYHGTLSAEDQNDSIVIHLTMQNIKSR